MAIIGAGGHAKVVLDALLAGGFAAEQVRVAAATAAQGQMLGSCPVIAPEFAAAIAGFAVHVAVGDNAARLRLLEEAVARGHALHPIFHPSALVAASARVADGAFFAAFAIVAPEAGIGRGAIVNHAAVVDHDGVLGDCTHVAPGAILGGGVRVGECAMIGANATVLPGLTIGARAIVGAGATVTRDVPDDVTVTGTPARILQDRR